jgi:phosphoserine phosphatase
LTRFLVVCDVDSTLIEDEAIDLLAQLAGSGPEVAQITADAMAGNLDFEDSLKRRVATLSGLLASALGEVRSGLQLTRGALELSAEVHALGGRICAVSGGFAVLLSEIHSQLQLDGLQANSLEIADGKLTGRLTGPIIGPKEKRLALEAWCSTFAVPLSQTIAVGDGANDLEMLSVAGLSVAFDAKTRVREAAAVSLAVRDLSQLLTVLPRLP